MGRIWDGIKRFGSKVKDGIVRVGSAVGKALRPVADVAKKVTHYTSYIPGTVGRVSGAVNTILKTIWKDGEKDDLEEEPSTSSTKIKAIGYNPTRVGKDGVYRNPTIIEPEEVGSLSGMGPLGKNLAGQFRTKPNPNFGSPTEQVTKIYRR